MKPAQVNKLYAKLSPSEQAALVIEAASKQDESAIGAIIEQVERKQCVAHHLDFARRIHALTTIIGQYGITYWKSRTLMLLACESVYNGNSQAEYTALRFLANTVALESAIVEICKELKVDVAAIKKMAGGCSDDVKPEELQKADAVLVKKYTDLFRQLAQG